MYTIFNKACIRNVTIFMICIRNVGCTNRFVYETSCTPPKAKTSIAIGVNLENKNYGKRYRGTPGKKSLFQMTDIRSCVGTLWHGLTSEYKHKRQIPLELSFTVTFTVSAWSAIRV